MKDFRKTHSKTLNILLHMCLTPLGISSFLWFCGDLANMVMSIYIITLSPLFPWGILLRLWVITCIVISFSLLLSTFIDDLKTATCMITLSYFGQDFAHWISGENTYQSTYQKSPFFLQKLLVHTYYLLPLTLDCFTFFFSAKISPLTLDTSFGFPHRLSPQ